MCRGRLVSIVACFSSNWLNDPITFVLGLVTGGGSGVGNMIASALVANGAKVYIAARKEKQLKEVCPSSHCIHTAHLLPPVGNG